MDIAPRDAVTFDAEKAYPGWSMKGGKGREPAVVADVIPGV